MRNYMKSRQSTTPETSNPGITTHHPKIRAAVVPNATLRTCAHKAHSTCRGPEPESTTQRGVDSLTSSKFRNIEATANGQTPPIRLIRGASAIEFGVQ